MQIRLSWGKPSRTQIVWVWLQPHPIFLLFLFLRGVLRGGTRPFSLHYPKKGVLCMATAGPFLRSFISGFQIVVVYLHHLATRVSGIQLFGSQIETEPTIAQWIPPWNGPQRGFPQLKATRMPLLTVWPRPFAHLFKVSFGKSVSFVWVPHES